MGSYSVSFLPSVEKDVAKIPKKDLVRLLARIQLLAGQPRPDGAIKLTGHDLYRLRQGNYRIVYKIVDAELIVMIIKIGHRKDVYR